MEENKEKVKKKIRKKIRQQTKRHYSLLISIIISATFLSVWSYINLKGLYSLYSYDPLKMPAVYVMMTAIHDGVYPWDEVCPQLKAFIDEKIYGIDADNPGTENNTENQDPSGPSNPGTEISSETQVADTTNPENQPVNPENPENPDLQPDPDPEVVVEELPPQPVRRDFIPVDDDYFCDALFIGDSRMVGLSEYCEPLDTRADFFVKRAMTIYQVRDGKKIKMLDGSQKSIWELLDEKQYGKIYIMLGINEIGVGDPEYFRNGYAETINLIREKQPNAFIFIMSIMHVSKIKNDSDNLYNNTNINARNDAIMTLADQERIFYLNVNESIDDENGAMKSELTFDGVHLLGSCFEPIHQYLLNHGVSTEPIPGESVQPGDSGTGEQNAEPEKREWKSFYVEDD